MSKVYQPQFVLLLLMSILGMSAYGEGMAQTLINSIDGVYIEYDTEFRSISDQTIQNGDVLVFDIPGVYDFLEERGIPLKNIVLMMEGIELQEFPPYMWGSENGVIFFKLSFSRLSTENRKLLYNLRGGAEKKVLLGLKFDELHSFTFSQPARVYFSNIAYWSRAGWILIIGFFLFFITLIIRFKSMIKDDVHELRRREGYIPSASYSFSKSQLAYWTFIIISCFIYIWSFTNDLGSINTTAFVLLGISAVTTAIGTTINKNEEEIAKSKQQNKEKEYGFESKEEDYIDRLVAFRTSKNNFFRDILSDAGGLSIHRLQTFVFNVVFGIAFIKTVMMDYAMPEFTEIQLGLLGLSNGTYVFIKNSENK